MIIFFSLEINSDVVSECIISNEERLLNCIDKKKPNHNIITIVPLHKYSTCICFFSLFFQLVWSESEKILPLLQDIQDFLASSRKRTVTEILDNVKAKILDKVKAGCIKVITAAMNILNCFMVVVIY